MSINVSGVGQAGISNSGAKIAGQRKAKFTQALQKKQAAINISKHAKQRLTSRELSLGQDDMNQLSAAMDELETKGSKESLLVYKNMGIIANVQNRTIITAMDMNELGTVTNIDSTKFIK
jgi:flagellar operon protein